MTVQGALLPDASPEDFSRFLAGFSGFGQGTEVETVNGHVQYTNEYWTARQRQAGRIHEVSYRACFKPQLPEFFIRHVTEPGDVVFDPFMGRGTTLIQAALQGRVPYGNDVNPVCRVLTEARLDPPAFAEVEERISEIPWGRFRRHGHDELLVFFHPKTLAHIEGLRKYFRARTEGGETDRVDRWIQMVALNRLTGHSSGFFSTYTMPPNQAVSIDTQRKINERRGVGELPCRDVAKLILKKSRSLLSREMPEPSRYMLLTGKSCSVPQIDDGEVSLTVTSPPFLDVVDYASDNWLRCWFLGIDPEKVDIAKHRNVADWRGFIEDTFRELARVTKPGGHVAFEVGEVRRGTVRLEEHVLMAVSGLPFRVVGVVINRQRFTKTANCWGVSNNEKGTNSNRIVLLEKVG